MSNYPPVRIVSPAQFDTATAQTAGSQRRAALTPDLGVKTALWGGLFIVEPASKTGIHHHGEQETIAYVLKGECCVRWGEHGIWRSTNLEITHSSGSWYEAPPHRLS